MQWDIKDNKYHIKVSLHEACYMMQAHMQKHEGF